MTLKELVKLEGYELVVDDGYADHPGAMGTPQRDELCAQMCLGNVIRIPSTLTEANAIYPISHEIAEHRCDFTGHHQRLWRQQCDILQRWCARLLAAQQAAQSRSSH